MPGTPYKKGSKELSKRFNRVLINMLLIFCLVLSSFAVYTFGPGSFSYAANSKRPEYIAHRGWSSRAPENTLAAFRLAAKNSDFYGVEFDVWESQKEPKYRSEKTTVIKEDGSERTETRKIAKDPFLLVMHDESIKRMCGVNKNIHNITRSSIGKYRIKTGNNVKKYRGQKIPTAEQALDTIYENSKGAVPVIELKERLSSRALRYLLEYLHGREAVIISFDFNAVADAEKMAAKKGFSDSIQTMYLSNSLKSGQYAATIRRMKTAGIDCISLKYPLVNKRTVKKYHKANIKVCIWTVPNKKTARKYAGMGVDYITINGL